MATNAEEARHLVDNISGDYVAAASIPSPLAQLLEAQVFATLAVADALRELKRTT